MEMFFIDQALLQNLIGATQLIQASPDLVQQDMPVLQTHMAALQSALAARMATLNNAPCQEEQALNENTQEAADKIRVNKINEKARRVIAQSREADSFTSVEIIKTGKKLLTEKEAAEHLSIHPISLKRRRLAGKGPKYIPLGPRQVRYEDIDLDEFKVQLKQGGLDA
jgi:hypothetical protein